MADRVEFDAVDRSLLRERYRDADVVVFPSTWEEPFGVVPLEAMACATPVVATAVGGSAEFLFDGDNCLRFTPGDPEALAAAIERLANDAALRARLVDCGLNTARQLTFDRMARDLEAWHVAAATGDPAARPTRRQITPPRHHAPS